MYEISVEADFAAAHAITIRGEREPVHGHNWHITATVRGPRLDAEGLLCDFHLIERSLREIADQYHNRSLNEMPPFRDRVNPSAENLARHIADELSRALDGRLPEGARLASIRVTEAPGCAATWLADKQA